MRRCTSSNDYVLVSAKKDEPHEHCAACGERILGIETSRRFDAVAFGRRRPRVA